jgi:hypothetical protein
MKYRRQGYEPSCGPVAIYNTLIWAGTKKTLKYLKKLCRYNGGTGICAPDLNRALNKVSGIEIEQFILYPKLSEIDDAIDRGCAVILRYYGYDGHNGHYVVCISRSDKFYTLANDRAVLSKGSPLVRRSRKNVRNYLIRTKDRVGMTSYPAAWIIRKS